jgi:hypothetical protein
VIKPNLTVIKWLGLLLAVSIIASGCSSLDFDITPPPTDVQVDQVPATPGPTQTAVLEAPPLAPTLSPGELEGNNIVVNVVDQTGGALLEQELAVELAGFEEFELVYEDAEILTSGARVIFSDAPFQEGRVYFASISLGGAIYRSEIVELGAETDLLELTIQIYETTSSDENLVIDRIHLLADFPSPDSAQIVEIYIVSNLGDATVVAENPGEASISFPLPSGAESIEFENGALGQRYLRTEDGFGDTVSIPPGSGEYQVLVYYKLPIQRNRINFSQEMPYPVRALTVMTPADEAVLKGSSLEDQGVQAIPDGYVQIYSGAELAKGETLDFRLTVVSETPALPTDGTEILPRGLVIGAGVLGGMIFLVGMGLFLRRRREDLSLDADPAPAENLEQILDSIIALEDLYQEGEITEKDYLKKRQDLKGKLKALEGDQD